MRFGYKAVNNVTNFVLILLVGLGISFVYGALPIFCIVFEHLILDICQNTSFPSRVLAYYPSLRTTPLTSLLSCIGIFGFRSHGLRSS